MSPVLLLCFLFPFLILFLRSKFTSCNNPKLPPSPPSLPVIGNLHQLGSNPVRSLYALARKHGPLMSLKFGAVPAVVVSSAKMAKEVMKVQDHVFCSRAASEFTRRLLYDTTDIGFAPYGDYLRQTRKASIVHLLNPKKVQSLGHIRQEEVALAIEKIKHEYKQGPVNLTTILQSLANDILCRGVLGKKYDKEYYELIQEQTAIGSVFHPKDVFPEFGWLSKFTGIDARIQRQFRRWEEFLNGVIDDHLSKDRTEMDTHFLDALLLLHKNSSDNDFKLTKDNVKAIIVDMFVAGTDGSYITMEWAMTELIRHPELMNITQAEIRKVAEGKQKIDEDDILKMTFLLAVIKETLRLYPGTPLALPRKSMEATEIQGYYIPANTTVFINLWAIGRDSDAWEAPEEFRPERFLNSDADFKGQHFHFVPFGGGRRICPGIQFAISTMSLALANLLYWFDWKIPNGKDCQSLDMDEDYGITMGKKTDLVVSATPANVL